MDKYDCPYYSETRTVCDDGECGCWECHEAIKEEKRMEKKENIEAFAKRLRVHLDYLINEYKITSEDSTNTVAFKTGVGVAVTTIEEFLNKEMK